MAVELPNTSLSVNDARILNALFDPETLPSSVARSKDSALIDSSLPPHPQISATQLDELEAHQNDIIKSVSSNSTPAQINSAITQVDASIAECPSYPSAHLNRAMLWRLKLEAGLNDAEKESIYSRAAQKDIDALFNDLAHAIHLCLPSTSPSSASVSPYIARILRTAHSHRAYLYLKAVETDAALWGLSKSELEEAASRDFSAAARFGDEVAREMSVRTNPYAKMCGAIVRNALREEREEYEGKH